MVRVPFPFTDRSASKARPAIVISHGAFNNSAEHSVMAMITSSSHTPWPLDHRIADLNAAGLNRPCVIRLKLFTLDHRLIEAKLGHLSTVDREAVVKNLRQQLPLINEDNPQRRGTEIKSEGD